MSIVSRLLAGHIQTARDIVEHPLNRNDRLRAMVRYLGWNIGRRLVDAEYVIRLAGDAELIVSNAENYSTLAYTQRLWDWADMLLLLHLLRPDDLFVDVGANVGAYTVLVGRLTNATVVAVEPVPETYRKLLRNIRLNDLAGVATAVHAGLAAKAGVLRFTTGRGGLNHVATDDSGIEVPVTTVDALMQGRSPVALKMDVEGYETLVLEGGPESFGKPELQVVVVELNGSGARYGYSDADVHATLCRYGFLPHDYDPVTRAISPRNTYNSDGLNTIYARPDSDWLLQRIRTGTKIIVRGQAV